MGNVHPYPKYLSREPSLHGHPAPLKKYGLVRTHLGSKSAINRTVHLLPCHAKMLIPGRFLQPTSPSPLPCCCPTLCHPHPGQKSLSQGSCISPSWLCSSFLPLHSRWAQGWDRSKPGFWLDKLLPTPSTASAALLILIFLVLPLRFDSLLPSGRAIFTLDLQGYLFYVTLCD